MPSSGSLTYLRIGQDRLRISISSAGLVTAAVFSQPKCGDGGESAFQGRSSSVTVPEAMVRDRGRGDKGAGQKEGAKAKNEGRTETRDDYISMPGDGRPGRRPQSPGMQCE